MVNSKHVKHGETWHSPSPSGDVNCGWSSRCT